jgi:hypothetical protein
MPVKQFENGLKLGRLPSPPDAVQFKFASYADLTALPTPPAKGFGHYGLVKSWPMFLNDQLGDCVIAGAQHQEQLYHAQANTTISLSDQSALKNYEAWGHYNPNDPNSDEGTDMAYAAEQWRRHGMVDAQGKMHRIAAYTELQPANVNQLKVAGYLFTAVGIGIQFPNFAMDQFNAGQPWDLPKRGANTDIEGGHYIPMVGVAPNRNIYVVTWGKRIEMTPAFYQRYGDIAIVHYSQEMLINAKSLDGFDDKALTSDLRAVSHAR